MLKPIIEISNKKLKTFCYNCGKILYEIDSKKLTKNNLKKQYCEKCNEIK